MVPNWRRGIVLWLVNPWSWISTTKVTLKYIHTIYWFFKADVFFVCLGKFFIRDRTFLWSTPYVTKEVKNWGQSLTNIEIWRMWVFFFVCRVEPDASSKTDVRISLAYFLLIFFLCLVECTTLVWHIVFTKMFPFLETYVIANPTTRF